MRGPVAGLPTAHLIEHRLPGVFLDDDFTRRFVAAFDEVLAPIFLTLDCLDAYLDPALAPADFVDWLAGWLAVDFDDETRLAQRRRVLAHAVQLHRWRGTRRGLVEQVRLLTGGEVEVADSGGCVAHAESGGPLPGESPAWARVTVRKPSSIVDESAVRAAAPAHVRVSVEVRP
jgi:phage tail-like protein